MNILITTISMASVLAAGAVSASVNFALDRVVDIRTQMTALYNNEEVLIVDGPNMPGNNDGHKFRAGGD